MNDPFKVIYKYKNSNRTIKYHFLIFLGNINDEKIIKVLNIFKNLNLYDTFMILTNEYIKLLEDNYSEYWYKYFFIHNHISFTFDKIKNNNNLIQSIKEKYSEDWYNKHINNFLNYDKKSYSFQNQFKNNNKLKILIKNKNINKQVDDNELDNYNIQNGGGEDDGTEEEDNDGNENNDGIDEEEKDNEEEGNDNNDGIDEEEEGNDNNEEIEEEEEDEDEIVGGNDDNIVDDNVIDDNMNDDEYINIEEDINGIESIDNDDELNIEDVDKLINEELELNKNISSKDNIEDLLKKYDNKDEIDKLLKIQEWDKTNDINMINDNLKDIYKKIYIFNQYIFKDDTIMNIKKKICCGFKKNIFYKNDDLLIPSRLYLWSCYNYIINDSIKLEKVILGHKWINKTELLNIDIEPNDKLYNYENLTGNLKLLQDNIKKYSSKISFEDDSYNILSDYDNFIYNNEIYMIDIYNDLGKDYNNDSIKLKNVYDTYVSIYYPLLTYNDFNEIINYLNGIKIENEINKINLIHTNINNDLIMENEIINIIEGYKKQHAIYNGICYDNFIINAVIHLNINYNNYNNNYNKLELFRIFDNYITDEKYPFIQYQTLDDKIIFKFYDKNQNYNKNNLNQKWFENTPYGINFKIKYDDKIMAISLNENGKIYYKIQWKEIEKATFKDIFNSFIIIRDLLNKINMENDKFNITIPNNNDFKYGFLNSILKFKLPDKYLISHNDLSDFARLFYPYVSVVIDPKKRISKLKIKNDISKYGTYLKYKRISKYDNEINIDKKILYYLKNYEFNQKILSELISKQFNITEDNSNKKIINIINKFPKLKKSRNILKKLDDVSNKYKSPGVGIHIMGKDRENYKIIITGVKSKNQLDDIVDLLNIILYLYIEIYLYKKKDKQYLLKKLNDLINIAKRRNKVNDIVEFNENVSNIKKMTKTDKDRLGFKPQKGENNWGRLCQNSGKIKRRPLIYTDNNIKDLLNQGYIYNENTKNYELKTSVKVGNKKKDIVLSVAKIKDNDGNNVFYTCNPKENGEYMYVGFLSKSKNPYGLCMPCCYKKDMMLSINKDIKDYHNKCIGNNSNNDLKIDTEKLYILRESNKIQDNRFSYLPKYLEFFFNINLKKDNVIKDNYFISSKKGYFFKYSFKRDDDIFLTAISICLDISVEQIKEKISNILLNNKNNNDIFYYLNNGDISLQFKTIDNYLKHIHYNYELDNELINDIICIPNVLIKEGLNIYILDKNDDDFNILIHNYENVDLFSDNNRKNIILIKDELNYYPIFMIKKNDNEKKINIQKIFNYNDEIIQLLYKFFIANLNKINLNIYELNDNKKTINILKKYNYQINYQIIDKRNKIKYIIVDKFIIPVKPSGSLYNIPIKFDYHDYLQSLDDTIQYIYDLYHKSNKELLLKPTGLYYTNKNNNEMEVNSIMINNNSIPVIKKMVSKDDLYKYAKNTKNKHFILEHLPIIDIIDNYIDKNEYIIDKRILSINEELYNEETYELFRYELSHYLNNNEELKNKIIQIKNLNENMNMKKNKIKYILYKICSNKLLNLFNEINMIKVDFNYKKDDKLIHISNNKIKYDNYKLNNYRKLCKFNENKDSCNINVHCDWNNDKCHLKINEINIIKIINKVSEELINNKLKSNEILNIDNYYITDIINPINFTYRNEQKIIKSNNNNMNKIFSEIFGLKSIPIIGKRKINKKSINKINNNEFPLEIIGIKKYQKIIYNNVIYRTYANSYFWNHTLLDIYEQKNLGYYSILQTDLSNYFKSQVIEWINYKSNYSIIIKNLDILKLNKNFLYEYKTYLTENVGNYKNFIIDLYILFIINKIPIIIYDNYDNIIIIIDNDFIYIENYTDNKILLKKYNDVNYNKNSINIKYNISNFSLTNEPSIISVIYY